MNNREKILDTALRLFNKHGTGEVSTNHIAEACGISPGNLYYHFRNKQEIIRELFQRMYALWDQGLPLPEDHAPMLEDLKVVVEANYQNIWQYRFAYRELVALLHQDPELRQGWLAVRQRGFEGFYKLFGAFAASGVFRMPEDPQVLTDLQEVCWLISEFWVTNLEVNGRAVNKTEMQRGVELMLRVLQPYLA